MFMDLKLADVAAALGTMSQVPERVARGYSIDSRTIAPGQLFFAIRGPRFDGHSFVAQALERGAVGAVVEESFWQMSPEPLRPSLLPVPDPAKALQDLGHWVRQKWGGRLVGITGSTGKSTTKEMTAGILGRRFRVLKSEGNLNNHYGLPLTLLRIEPQHEVVVAELAMSAAGEIALLARLAAPQVGVVTNVAPVHLQFFDSVESIARAKKELVDNLPPGATTVLNHDDPRVRGFGKGFAGRVVTFGFGEGAEFRAVECRPDAKQGCRFRLESAVLQGEFYLPIPGRHNVENALAAIAASSIMGVAEGEVREALESFQPLAQRSEIITLPNGVILISDCYNSNPLAMENMLETLANWPGARRRIVVAGEMLELGSTSPDLHRAIGRRCHAARVDGLIGVQGDARYILEGAQQSGLQAGQMKFFPGPEAAAPYCRAMLQPGDVVLVKGSRGVRLEVLVDHLRASYPAAEATRQTESRG
jgi:UDP-N-acetylmuramoyl-tripeptide--D-alanyl-D-alanine ligase